MKITRLVIQNYKAFGQAEIFEIEGKNVLIYGNNGSGKTSLAHALQALIQSSAKTTEQIEQAFDRASDASIVNLFAPAEAEAFVRLTTDDNGEFTYAPQGNTRANPVLQGAGYVSDFMNYRLLFRFYNFRENEAADIFPIFRDEFLPNWFDAQRNQFLSDWYQSLLDNFELLKIRKAKRNSREYRAYPDKLQAFNQRLAVQVEGLVNRSNDFLKIYLASDEPLQVSFRWIRGLELEGPWKLSEPIIQLALLYDGRPVNHPHIFLNEARLTALALAIRFAAFEERSGKVSDFKILVLDDLLISLDMSLRMKIVPALLDSYKAYQLFILTHDKSFYNYLKQTPEFDAETWKCFEMYENTTGGRFAPPVVLPGKDYLAKAQEYLQSKEYEVCAIYLHKKAEELIRTFFDPTLESLTRYYILEELANALGGVNKEYMDKKLKRFTALLDTPEFTLEMIQQLRAEPFQGNPTLTQQEIGQIRNLRAQVLSFLEDHYTHRDQSRRYRNELEGIAKRVSLLRSIVLNPGAHQGVLPLYDSELQGALNRLAEFEKMVKYKQLYS